MTVRDSVYTDYNDPSKVIFDVTSVPSWKATPPLHGAHSPAVKLTPRVKAGIAVGGVVLAATGMIAWSSYESAQANADVRRAQIQLDQQRLDLQRQQQAAQDAKNAAQETPAQAARRQAVQACVDKATTGGGYNSADAIAGCSKAFPAIDSSGMVTTSDTVNEGGSGASGGPTSVVGLIVLGAVGAGLSVGWAKKKLTSVRNGM